MSQTKQWWTSRVGGFDDFDFPITNIIIDGKTTQRPWAIMTPESHAKLGCGLGIGKGQKYELQEDGKWLLTEGGEL